MRVAAFGATGGTGRNVVEQGLSRGLEITAFVHKTPGFDRPVPHMSVANGDVLNPGDVEKAVENQDAVVSTLGVPRDSHQPVVSEGTRNIISAMKKFGVERLIVESAHGAGDSALEMPLFIRLVVRGVLLKNQFDDKDQMERLVRESDLKWTVVRPARLTDGPATGKFRAGERIAHGMPPSVSRADVARFMLDQLESTEYVRRMPTITG